MKRYRVLFTGGTLSASDIETTKQKGLDIEIERADLTEIELALALRDKDAYILGGVERATAYALRQSPTLKVVAFLGVGYQAFIDVDAATAYGIAVTNAPGANARAVAEFTVALILDGIRRVTYLANETKQGVWREVKTRNVHSKTLGIIGMGTIGTLVASIAARGLEMNIIYHSRRKKTNVDQELRARFVSLEELLGTADVISFHASFTPETDGLLNDANVKFVRPGAVLVNTSEAELVDPRTLLHALLDERIAIAAMDGYYVEPVPKPEDDPYGLLRLPDDRFLITPHTANLTEESLAAMLEANVSSILNVLEYGDDRLVVNPGFRANTTP